MKCKYCNGDVLLKDSKIIYGESYGNVWVCENFPDCNSFVGCHKGTSEPLGTLADPELRELRKQCHVKLDVLWKRGYVTRNEAYEILRKELKLPKDQAHIGMLDEEQCVKLLRILAR